MTQVFPLSGLLEARSLGREPLLHQARRARILPALHSSRQRRRAFPVDHESGSSTAPLAVYDQRRSQRQHERRGSHPSSHLSVTGAEGAVSSLSCRNVEKAGPAT